MRPILLLALALAGVACSPHNVRCNGRLRAINPTTTTAPAHRDKDPSGSGQP